MVGGIVGFVLYNHILNFLISPYREVTGKSQFVFDDRPYVIMTDHAFVDLGSYR